MTSIKLACVVLSDNAIVVAVSLNGIEQSLLAVSSELQTIWHVKGENIKATIQDRQTRMVSVSGIEPVLSTPPQSYGQKVILGNG
jgi:hypothetical protein